MRPTSRFWARLALVAIALAPASWFASGLPVKGVDSFFSLHPEGRLGVGVFSWDARVSTGSPAAELNATLLNAVQAGLAELGLATAAAQALLLSVLAGAAACGAYRLVMVFPAPPTCESHKRLAGTLAALFWVANPFSLSFVWWHQLLIEVTWATLPWLVVLLIKAVRSDEDATRWVPALLLVAVAGSAGLTHVYLVTVTSLLVSLALCLKHREKRWSEHLSRVAAFFFVFGLGVAWWVIPTLPLIPSLVAAAGIHGDSLAQLRYASRFSTVGNIVSMRAVPQLYARVAEAPYVSWQAAVTTGLGRVVVWVPPAAAAVGGIRSLLHRGTRLPGVGLAASALVAIIVAKGLNPPFPRLSLHLVELPLGAAFRHALDKVSFLIVLPFTLLLAAGVMSLPWRKLPSQLAIGVVAAGLVFLSLPWWTGSVIPAGGEVLPSAQVEMPRAYDQVGRWLAQQPSGGKTMVLPFALNGEAAFAWRSGIQPNMDPLLQDWAPDRSTLATPSGNAYSDLVSSTLARAAASLDEKVFALARLWGVDSWVVHADWAEDYFAGSMRPGDAYRFLNLDPAPALRRHVVPRRDQALPVGPEGVVVLNVRTRSLPVGEDKLVAVGGATLQLNREGFFALRNVARGEWDPVLPPLATGRWHELRLVIDGSRLHLVVNGVGRGRGVTVDDASSFWLLAPCATCGKTELVPSDASAAGGISGLASRPERTFVSTYLTTYSQSALPLIYAASSVARIPSMRSEQAALEVAHDLRDDRLPVVLDDDVPLPEAQLDADASVRWTRRSPTAYDGTLWMDGWTVFTFLQSHDDEWELEVEGAAEPPAHVIASGFGNAWIVKGSGHMRWRLIYRRQLGFSLGLGYAALLVLGSTVMLLRTQHRKRRSSTLAPKGQLPS